MAFVGLVAATSAPPTVFLALAVFFLLLLGHAFKGFLLRSPGGFSPVPTLVFRPRYPRGVRSSLCILTLSGTVRVLPSLTVLFPFFWLGF